MSSDVFLLFLSKLVSVALYPLGLTLLLSGIGALLALLGRAADRH
jgi:hypothetical protein